ncbi:MAG: FAD-dependent oxidoreductase [Dehalococcoidia bacterium]
MSNNVFDYAVVGAGLIGSATAKYISESNPNTVLVGPSEPDNKKHHDGIFGSHYDEGRITRISDSMFEWAYLAKKSIESYKTIEKKSGINFYTEVGSLSVGTESYCNNLIETSNKVNFEYLTQEDLYIDDTYQYINLPKKSKYIFEPRNSGYISARKLVHAQKNIFKSNKGKYINDFVVNISKSKNIFNLKTNNDSTVFSKQILICAGAFTNFTNILRNKLPVEIKGRTTLLGEIKKKYISELKKYPSLIHKPEEGEDVYFLPAITYPNGKTYIKIGWSHFNNIDSYKEAISWFKGEIESNEKNGLETELNSIYDKKIFNSVHIDTCAVTWTKNKYPIIDEVEKNLFVSVGGNGHAAKSSDHIGYISAKYITNGSWDQNLNRSLFTLESNI